MFLVTAIVSGFSGLYVLRFVSCWWSSFWKRSSSVFESSFET